MRTDQEFREEIFERAKQYKKNQFKSTLRAIPIIIVISIMINVFGSPNTIKAVNLVENIQRNEVEVIDVNSEFINHQIDLSIEIFKESYSNKKNSLISPISAIIPLAMCTNGATDETLKEMEKVLGNELSLNQINSNLYSLSNLLSKEELKIANSVWVRDRFEVYPNFLQKVVDYYQADVYQTSFDHSTINDMNTWVKENTNEMIDKIVDELEYDEVMHLMNAIAFDAEWKEPYRKQQVHKTEFRNIDGNIEYVNMMYSMEYNYLENKNVKGFIKPYKDFNYSFIAILPNENIDFNEYVQSFDSKEYLNLINNKQNQAVETGLPKFKYENSIELNTILNNMGIKKAFNPLNAQLMELGKSEFNLYISNVKQKTIIDVNEYGTKAFAITDLEVSDSAAENTKQVILNRPFMYMIIDNNTNLPIFIGSIVSLENPS